MERDDRDVRISAGRARFRRAHRLRSPLEFERVRRAGRRVSGTYFALAYAPHAPRERARTDAPARLGLSVGKRVGDAVRRNRVKRRVREIWRQLLPDLAPGWDVIVSARTGAAEADFVALDAELRHLLGRARIWRTNVQRGSVQ